MLHSANWLVLMYNLMLCIWLVIPVFSGQKMRMWSKTKQMLFELGSHAIVFSVCCFHNLLIEKVAGLFVGLTFIGNSYGKVCNGYHIINTLVWIVVLGYKCDRIGQNFPNGMKLFIFTFRTFTGILYWTTLGCYFCRCHYVCDYVYPCVPHI